MSIDYGKKRTGLAWTDPLQIIATGIGSYDTREAKQKIVQLGKEEDIEKIVLGYPTRMNGKDTHVTEDVRRLKEWLRKKLPDIEIHLLDERFTSKMAMDAMVKGGAKKKKRRNKHLINEVSATILLQDFMNEHSR